MHPTRLILTGALLAAANSAVAQASQTPTGRSAASASGDQALIANALSAAPASVAARATVVDHDGRVLRQGTSGWVCMPDLPDVPNDSPMCLDAPWREFIDAWMHKRAPTVTQLAFGYMLQGDLPVSNTDPFATGPTPTNQWIPHGGPHVMILVPDARFLESLPTDPTSGEPFVMWKGTAYAHVMLPVTQAPKR